MSVVSREVENPDHRVALLLEVTARPAPGIPTAEVDGGLLDALYAVYVPWFGGKSE